MTSPTIRQSRELERQVAGQATSDGSGVRLTRVLTQDLHRRLDPFLMLDAFRSDDPSEYIGGFPAHPHRGFETVTYLLAGRIRHRDSAGNEGQLRAGDVQWMTAARGIVHSEMPEQENGLMQGFQLWLNLPARVKDAVQRPVTAPIFLDVRLPAGTRYAQALPAAHNAFVYVYEGEVRVGDRGPAVGSWRMGILTTDAVADGVVLAAERPSRLLLIGGAPLREPIAQHGPFVMNTIAELRRAFDDYAAGRLGAIPAREVAAEEVAP